MRKEFHLTAFVVLLIVSAQRSFSQDPDWDINYLGSINAFRVDIKKCNDFNLRGNVKSVIEINSSGKDTSYYLFNAYGFLLKMQAVFPSSREKRITKYIYENGKLKKAYATSSLLNRKTETLYDMKGYPEKVIMDFVDFDEKFHEETTYIYDDSHENLQINYKHRNQSVKWNLIQYETFKFKYDNKRRVVRAKYKSQHSDAVYGTTATYAYDSLSGRLKSATYLDDCAGSNSCLILFFSREYDSIGNIIAKRVTDNTIRNSFLNFGYAYLAKYNEKNEVIESYIAPHENSSQQQKNLPDDYEKLKKNFDYEYDVKGNWIRKFEGTGKERKLIARRKIEYYH